MSRASCENGLVLPELAEMAATVAIQKRRMAFSPELNFSPPRGLHLVCLYHMPQQRIIQSLAFFCFLIDVIPGIRQPICEAIQSFVRRPSACQTLHNLPPVSMALRIVVLDHHGISCTVGQYFAGFEPKVSLCRGWLWFRDFETFSISFGHGGAPPRSHCPRISSRSLSVGNAGASSGGMLLRRQHAATIETA